MLDDLKGKRALITGSSTGIGAALAREFARLGVAVAVHGHSNADAAQQVVDDIIAARGTAIRVLGDVSKPEDCARIVEEAAHGLGGLDILINNAGAMVERVTNAAFSNDLFDQVYNLNVRSVLAVTKAALPYLKAQGKGAIVNTGSVAGRMGGYGGSTVYASAKAAVHSITRNAAREFAPFNVRVNTVAPGFIVTPFHDSTPEETRKQIAQQIPMGRLGTPEECVGAYVFLCSESMSGYITGQIIDVNGGQLMS
ncbi:SDR family oxidoreductase [Arsenicitalea aurantiaca]|uniref:SDR family oxidoreductase n=1 Tax=Arsenicitalea aurantiaca TaxID=1783274 RepID=A0A433XBB0_9HYPH|nr:SDR family oxidoreductase [Arsenicitalea aurantiaca]RUT31288.1 SDR family oxidoreductase [Arsenicitalea aurantiaca]